MWMAGKIRLLSVYDAPLLWDSLGYNSFVYMTRMTGGLSNVTGRLKDYMKCK